MTACLDFNIGYLIGNGADAEVRHASSLADGKQFAVKILKIKTEEQKERFKREIEITRYLAHDNIVKYYETKEGDEGTLYLFMDHIKGRNLEKLMDEYEDGLEEKRVKGLFYQLINAIGFIHSRGIYHRDIKLENLMLDEDLEKIFLIDFGYCGLSSNGSTIFNEPVGSPLYLCPEKMRNLPYCGPSSDVWSLGICLFKLLNGFYPFYPHETMSNEELSDQILNSDVYINPCLTSFANDLLCRMLDKNPLNRITIPQILNHPWFKN
jgi:serine/threonine protein kinase